MTKNRKLILDTIKSQKSPINAGQVFSQLKNSMDLATVYRSLQYLEQNSLLSSFVFECNNRGIERYYFLKKTEHEHFMHCEGCHKFISFTSCTFEDTIQKIEKDYGFKTADHHIALTGFCKKCAV